MKMTNRRYRKWLAPTLIVLVASVALHWQANRTAGRIYQLSILPRLSVDTAFRSTWVGESTSRDDEIVCVPVKISNNSDAYALGVELDLFMSSTPGVNISLNEYLDRHNRPRVLLNRLEPGEEYTSPTNEFCLSVDPNAVERYRDEKIPCKVEIAVTWHDVSNRTHRLIHLTKLEYAQPTEVIGSYFWFKPVKSYDTLSGWWEWLQIQRDWGLPVSF